MVTTARFWRYVDKSGPGGCWLWTGTILARGYGQFWVGPGHRGLRVRAHRFAYEMLVGPIPDGLVIDHLCRVPLCVNPAHMEPVTGRVNIRRGIGPSAVNARKTHCHRGHPFTPANTLLYRGSRCCRACMRAASQRARDRRRAQAA